MDLIPHVHEQTIEETWTIIREYSEERIREAELALCHATGSMSQELCMTCHQQKMMLHTCNTTMAWVWFTPVMFITSCTCNKDLEVMALSLTSLEKIPWHNCEWWQLSQCSFKVMEVSLAIIIQQNTAKSLSCLPTSQVYNVLSSSDIHNLLYTLFI